MTAAAPDILMGSAHAYHGAPRLVEWVGHPGADYLDKVDPNDRYGRTRRELLYTGAYSRAQARTERAMGGYVQSFRSMPGITVRELRPQDVPGLRRVYRFGAGYGPNGAVVEMDAADAAALMLTPVALEFRYVDGDGNGDREPRQHQPGPSGDQAREPAATGLVLARLLTTTGGPPPGGRVMDVDEYRHAIRRR